jgi:hypothetical protein
MIVWMVMKMNLTRSTMMRMAQGVLAPFPTTALAGKFLRKKYITLMMRMTMAKLLVLPSYFL